MSTYEYQIQGEHTSGLTPKHYHGEAISTLNSLADANIPSNAVISSIQVKYSGKVSVGDTYVYVGFTNSSDTEPGYELINTQLTTSKPSQPWTAKVPFSGRTINSQGYSRLNVWASSGIIMKKYTCYDFRIIWTYSIPKYTVTVNAGTGGTVTGSGTYQNQTTATVTATPNRGYKFVGWANQSGAITSTVNPYSFTVTANTTFSAVFEPIPIEVTVESYEGQNGATATISGAGQYKFGDTITIKADIPQYHEFFAWYCSSSAGNLVFKENPLVITLNESFVNQGDTSGKIKFSCAFPFTGYTLKGNVSPENSGVVELGYQITEDFTDYWSIPEEGMLVGGENNLFSVEGALVRAVPNRGYKFAQWFDGGTANPREANLTGDTTFTAIFELDKINKVYAGYPQPKAVFVGIEEVDSIYTGDIKNYG